MYILCMTIFIIIFFYQINMIVYVGHVSPMLDHQSPTRKLLNCFTLNSFIIYINNRLNDSWQEAISVIKRGADHQVKWDFGHLSFNLILLSIRLFSLIHNDSSIEAILCYLLWQALLLIFSLIAANDTSGRYLGTQSTILTVHVILIMLFTKM